jgi:uncharacterized membrane protein YcaP (DUF421 family)
MDTIVKSAFVYIFLWAIIRITGRRTMGKMTPFDFVLVLLVGSAMQRALTGQDYSLTNAVLIVSTLVVMDVLLSLAGRDLPSLGKILKGLPMVVVEEGRPLLWRMHRARLNEDDILEAARERHGIERMDKIKFAILETNGEISIIPAQP